ncbi:hypothetical protein J1605_021048 [Eschrichtius robustus]|uniref:Uncharacterized protein n=1 Tax=Eschrichtius robustus TaxID=9764 RepID=A0AB34HK94_ESCRO|nr:hypothetical protein J1605_021048 [Eschrichtius robustus]
MNEKHPEYAELKHIPTKKQMQKEKTKEQLIYAEAKICTSKSNRTKITRTESPEEKGKVYVEDLAFLSSNCSAYHGR